MLTRKEFIKRMCGATALAAAGAAGAGAWWLKTPQFGRRPSQKRLDRLHASPNWQNGAFRNYEPLSVGNAPVAKKEGRFKIMWKFLFGDKSALIPPEPLKPQKTDLKALDPAQDAFVWFGHSSLYFTLGGRRILVDPVFSPYASPAPFINRAFPGSNAYSADDFGDIDLLVITHDHWDHLDYPTIIALKPKIRRIVAPLGVGEYFEQWGFDPEMIVEGDWWEKLEIFDGVSFTVLPTRHFSGRLYRPNQTLWCAYLIETPRRRVFLSGDGGYGSHVGKIAQLCGSVEWAFLENGQYNVKWPNCHSFPEEAALMGEELGAKFVVPIHNTKFALSEHTWDEPVKRLRAASEGRSYHLVVPAIGEAVQMA